MVREIEFKRIFATFFGGVYIFVALFSQNFHHHGSAEIFKDFHFKKSEKTFSTDTSVEVFSDCLSCHILHTGNFLVPQDFQLSFLQFGDFQKQIFSYQQRFAKREFFYLPLRGPPVNFI